MRLISNSYMNALLADATYALSIDGWQNKTGIDLEGALRERMTSAVAKYIGENFTVVTQKKTDDFFGSGFDATVWKDNTSGKVIVSMRGTKGLQDLLSDASLATTGDARKQIVDMVNWWFKITTPEGQNARQIQLEPQYDNSTPPVLVGSHYVTAPNVPGIGLVSAEDLAKGIEVNGHSLGGYLATAFTRLLGSHAHVEHTSTFNSAGFAPGSEGVFIELQNLIGSAYGLGRFPNSEEQTNYFALNGINTTTNSLWFNQAGKRVELFNERSRFFGSDVPNHYMYKLTDALALGAALEKLDPTLTTARLNLLLEAGSNETQASIEGLFDAVRHALLGPSGLVATPASDAGDSAQRATYHDTLAELQSSEVFKTLTGKVVVRMADDNLEIQAKSDFGAFLALHSLSMVVIGPSDANALAILKAVHGALAADWLADANARLYGDSSYTHTYTDAWYQDRAALQQALLRRNQQNNGTGQVFDAHAPAGQFTVFSYTDPASGQAAVLSTIASGVQNVRERHVMFGAIGADNLQGFDNVLGDHLYGGAGADRGGRAISGRPIGGHSAS